MAQRDGRQELGRQGESDAVRFLVNAGLVILDRNWRSRRGEIDIIARDGADLVFVEVKTRASLAYGHPFEAVTPAKLARLRVLASQWCEAHPFTSGNRRIDVVSILAPPGQPMRIEHLRGVFS